MKGAVAAGHTHTAEAALEILRAGGNAFDAALAAFFAACVAEPVLASPGGGGFLLARESGGRARVYDFFVQTPLRKRQDNALDFRPVMVDFGSAKQEFHIGLGSCAVPGCIAGMFAVHRDLGSVPMRVLLQPAVDLARAGVALNALQAYIFELVAPIYTTPSAAPYFSNGEQVKRRDESPDLRQLGAFFEVLGSEGEDLFYRGEIGASVAAACAAHGGHLSRGDFEAYCVSLRRPLAIRYHEVDLLTNPPPSSGGALIHFGLSLLAPLEVGRDGFGSYPHLRTLVEVMRQTSNARVRHGDSAHEQLFDPELLSMYREQVAERAAALRGTTHVSVIDAAGNVAALSVSNGEGCGEMVPGAGFMLNNMLGEQDLNPRGFHQWPENTRMTSMMAPSLLSFPDGRLVAAGSGGSNRIRTALLQVFSNLIDFAQPLPEAVAGARVHIEDRVLNMESVGIDQHVVARLTAEFDDHRLFPEPNLFFGGTHCVARDGHGAMGAVGDPRRDGVGLTIP